jgi:hypothetical protein
MEVGIQSRTYQKAWYSDKGKAIPVAGHEGP